VVVVISPMYPGDRRWRDPPSVDVRGIGLGGRIGPYPLPLNLEISNGSRYFGSTVPATGFLAASDFFVSRLPRLSPFGHRAFLFWFDPKPGPVFLTRTAGLTVREFSVVLAQLASRREARWHH